jgi:hypothetical protein
MASRPVELCTLWLAVAVQPGSLTDRPLSWQVYQYNFFTNYKPSVLGDKNDEIPDDDE